mmetsp:Transcript_117686/g.240633  ORF Transcript_117686/g.240633 Transcript_117686/m.240633 type:complete len:82 (-) Transcript_117686:107-352(-)
MGKFCVLLLSLCCSGHLAGAVQVGRGLKTEIQMPTVAATTTSEAMATANITTTVVLRSANMAFTTHGARRHLKAPGTRRAL